MPLKPYLKHIIYQSGLAKWLDGCMYRLQSFRNRGRNEQYRKQQEQLVLPADYVLYETYQLDYQKFIEDGALAAIEITAWTNSYIDTDEPRILDWGCGAGRITRHLPALQPNATIYGCDVNEGIIEWNKIHYRNISFTTINNFTPTPYADSFFDMVYGFSVFTHIDAAQEDWVKELYRIISVGGILLITTQGSYYFQKLLPGEKKKLMKNGIFTKSYPKHGHRMMSTYHQPEHFKNRIAQYFNVLEYYDGTTHPNKAGYQDVWILQKK